MRKNFRSKKQFNKQIILRLITIFLISQILFCASAKRYVANRGNDLKDIVNIGVEKDVYGIVIHLGFPVGYQDAIKGEGYGLRNGYFGVYSTGDRHNKIYIFDAKEGDSVARNEEHIFPGDSKIYISTSYHKINNLDDTRAARKQYLRVAPQTRICTRTSGAKYRYENLRAIYRCTYYSSYYGFPIELSIGYKYGFRIGINSTELFDFLVGVFGFDPDRDDVSYYVTMKAPQPLKEKDWEFKLDALDENMNKRLTK